MWELDSKESWEPKNWCFWTVVLEKTFEHPLDCKEIKPVNPKGSQSWIVIGRTDAEAEAPILWPPDAKNWLIWKAPDAGKDWRQEEKGMTEDEMVGCHYWPDGHEFEQAPAVGDGQGSLACCSPWGCKESDSTEGLNWTEECIVFLLFHILTRTCLIIASLIDVKWYLIVVLVCTSPMISDVEQLSTYLLAIYFFGKMTIQVLCPFLTG